MATKNPAPSAPEVPVTEETFAEHKAEAEKNGAKAAFLIPQGQGTAPAFRVDN